MQTVASPASTTVECIVLRPIWADGRVLDAGEPVVLPRVLAAELGTAKRVRPAAPGEAEAARAELAKAADAAADAYADAQTAEAEAAASVPQPSKRRRG